MKKVQPKYLDDNINTLQSVSDNTRYRLFN